ncbi:S8 family serine peptidase [Natrialbaceae archaeon GCM10025810]|uniref:S8 family peptidase n=1 Tax=Halovalidus salilacus TaxID=3075124 RepID=UPI003615C61D
MTPPITRRRLLQLAGIGTAGTALGTGIGSARQDPQDRFIVGTDRPEAARAARTRANGVAHEFDFGEIGGAISGRFPEEAIEALERRPGVRYVERNATVEAHDHADDGGSPYDGQVLPWGVDRVGADEAHHDDETGDGAAITIVDTGIDPDHETLADAVAGGRAWRACQDGCGAEWADDHGHGTHVAGAAAAPDTDRGIIGVAPGAELYAAKVLDADGYGTLDDVAAAIQWATDEGHDVVNLSLGGEDSSLLADACRYARENGVVVVASAGNAGPDGAVTYPAAYDDVLGVSAVDENDDVTEWSSRGEGVDLAAPGASVLSAAPDDEYLTQSGTSMAAPHVSGAVAHLLADASSEEARERLLETAEDLGFEETEQGAGLVDVVAAIASGDDAGDTDESDDGDESDADESDDGDEPAEPTLTVDRFDLEDRNGLLIARVGIDWAVSADGGELEAVTTTMRSLADDETVDSETTTVDGASADGEHELEEIFGRSESYEIELLAVAVDGTEASATERFDA